ncbi:MAG: histidine phosphatase family protein [Acetomicrobium sp.]
MKRIIFLRHGKTEWNMQSRYQGKTDVPLSDEGRLQARRVALRLKSLGIDAIYASSLVRASETAAIVSKLIKVPIKGLLKELQEMDFGAWEGMVVTDVERTYRDAYRWWRQSPEEAKIPGGEDFVEVVERVTGGMQKVLKEAGENILVVAHGGSIRAALVGLLALDASAVWRIRIDNCSLTSMELWDGRVMLAFANDTLHLLVDDLDLVCNLPILA